MAQGSGSRLIFFSLPGNPLRSSGDLLRQESGFESLQDLGELSPNLNFLEQTALSLKHGLVSWGGQEEGRDVRCERKSKVGRARDIAWWSTRLAVCKVMASIPTLQEINSRQIILSSDSTDGPKDTSVEDALERTYVPQLKTLEEDVMEAMGIQETRRYKKVYWY